MSFRQKNRVLLAAIEPSPGTPVALNVTDHAIKTEGIAFADDFQTQQPDEHTGKLDASKPVPAGGFLAARFGLCLGHGLLPSLDRVH